MKNENLDTLLCITRDGCLLEIIFSYLYPEYKCKKFHSSRRMNINYNDEYKNYIKKNYIHGKCIFFDLHGGFVSGRKLFLEVFNYLPRVHIFLSNCKSTFDTLTFNIFSEDDKIEKFNSDIVGTLIDMKNDLFIRRELEYNIDDAIIYRDTIKSFCNYFKDKSILKSINCLFLNEYYNNIDIGISNINYFIENEATINSIIKL
jgi:hypothetical protein